MEWIGEGDRVRIVRDNWGTEEEFLGKTGTVVATYQRATGREYAITFPKNNRWFYFDEDEIERATKIEIYAVGLCYMSVCVPGDMPIEEVEESANLQHPSGVSHKWSLNDKGQFADGTPMPCVCEGNPTRRHYLLSC